MTGYEFTKFKADYTSKMKAKRYYDVNMLAFLIRSDYERVDVNYLELSDYRDTKDWFIDSTMSCDLDEAKQWMKYYMSNAIAYGIQTKNIDWQTKFMAAYDIFNSLCAA